MTFLKVNNRPVAKTWNGLVNDLFNDFENNYGQQKSSASAPVNIAETADGYHLEVSAPGRNKENFSLNVENNTLTISYDDKKVAEVKADGEQEVKAPEVKNVRREFTTQSFKRSFALDDKINADGIQAKYEDGLLKVLLPKKAEVKPTVTQINVQ